MAVTEYYEHKRERWKRITHEPYERYLVGLDPGFTIDPTAICICHHREVPLTGENNFIVRYDKRETEQKLLGALWLRARRKVAARH